MAPNETTPQHCPGYAKKSFTCNCQECGAEKEVFSDEFDRSHKCGKCGATIDFKTCKLAGEGKSVSPR